MSLALEVRAIGVLPALRWSAASPCGNILLALMLRDCKLKKSGKPRMGRPPTGIRPFTGARFSKETLNAIDRYAKANQVSRSEAIRRLVEKALSELK